MSKALLLLALVMMAASHATAQLGSRLVQRMQGGQATRQQQSQQVVMAQQQPATVGGAGCVDEWVADKTK